MKRSIAIAMVLAACRETSSKPLRVEPPAHVEQPVPEGDLAIVHLRADAIARLGIETATVEDAELPAIRRVGGEVIVPPGRTIAVVAPMPGLLRAGADAIVPGTKVRAGDVLLRLAPLASADRDVRARAEREVAAAAAQLAAADARVQRIQQLIGERAGSQRMFEEARAARDVAQADLEHARARARTTRETPLLADVTLTVRAPEDGIVRTLSAVPGQSVAAGSALLELVAVDALQVRVPIYAGDLIRLDAEAPAIVQRLGGGAGIEASPIAGPPTGDAALGTVDHYYALASGGAVLPGERVMVEVPLRETEPTRVIPAASVVYDAQGAAWLYTCVGEHAFRRARIDPIRRVGDHIVFARGPALGTCVAAVGVAEIFGSEFEPGH